MLCQNSWDVTVSEHNVGLSEFVCYHTLCQDKMLVCQNSNVITWRDTDYYTEPGFTAS